MKVDTGESLRWRHLHAAHVDETDEMILHWVADQHGGQAKGVSCVLFGTGSNFLILTGLGLHLQKLSQTLAGKFDLHECSRLLSDLSPYDHLHRLYRLCVGHAKQNIRKCAVSEEVRNMMRSLICMVHDDWDGTLLAIEELGGKPGRGIYHVLLI